MCEWSETCLFYNFIFFLTQFLSACKAAYRSSSWQASCSALVFHGLIVSLCSYSTICIYVPCNLYTERWCNGSACQVKLSGILCWEDGGAWRTFRYISVWRTLRCFSLVKTLQQFYSLPLSSLPLSKGLLIFWFT